MQKKKWESSNLGSVYQQHSYGQIEAGFVNDGLRRPKVKAMPYPHWDSAENGFPIFLSSPLSSSQKQTSTEKFLAVLPDLDSKKSPKGWKKATLIKVYEELKLYSGNTVAVLPTGSEPS